MSDRLDRSNDFAESFSIVGGLSCNAVAQALALLGSSYKDISDQDDAVNLLVCLNLMRDGIDSGLMVANEGFDAENKMTELELAEHKSVLRFFLKDLLEVVGTVTNELLENMTLGPCSTKGGNHVRTRG